MNNKLQSSKENFFRSYQRSHNSHEFGGGSLKRSHPGRSQFGPTLIVIAAICTGLAWAGFTIFGGKTNFQKENVRLEITAPDKSAAGASFGTVVTVSNTSREPLTEVAVTIEYPLGFVFSDAQPSPGNTKKNYWSLGLLKGGERRTILVNGILAGAVGDKKNIFAVMYYHPASLSAEFTAQGTKTITLDSTSFSLSIDGPKQLGVSDQATYTITYPDFSAMNDREKIEIHTLSPNNFVIDSLVPPADKDKNLWNSSTLLSRLDKTLGHGTIIVKGHYVAPASGIQQYAATLGIVLNGQFSQLDQRIVSSEIGIQNAAQITMNVDGKTVDYARLYGPPLAYHISFHNTGATPIEHSSVTLDVPSSFIDWQRSIYQDSGTIGDHTISWELSHIDAGATKELTATLAFKRLDALGPDKNVPITSTVRAVLGDTKTLTLQGPTISTTINSDTELVVRAEELEGEHTDPSYRVVFTLHNSLHELRDLAIKSVFPEGVRWLDMQNLKAGELSFSEQSRTLEWKLNRMPITVPELKVSFAIAVSRSILDPTKDQPILQEIVFSAEDDVTKKQIALPKPALTSASIE